MSAPTARSRKGRIIYYDGTGKRMPPAEGGYTLGEWLVFWTWMYLVDRVDVLGFMRAIDYVSPEMPGALDQDDWDEHTDYLRLVAA